MKYLPGCYAAALCNNLFCMWILSSNRKLTLFTKINLKYFESFVNKVRQKEEAEDKGYCVLLFLKVNSSDEAHFLLFQPTAFILQNKKRNSLLLESVSPASGKHEASLTRIQSQVHPWSFQLHSQRKLQFLSHPCKYQLCTHSLESCLRTSALWRAAHLVHLFNPNSSSLSQKVPNASLWNTQFCYLGHFLFFNFTYFPFSTDSLF